MAHTKLVNPIRQSIAPKKRKMQLSCEEAITFMPPLSYEAPPMTIALEQTFREEFVSDSSTKRAERRRTNFKRVSAQTQG